MNFEDRRTRLAGQMAENSMLILYSGVPAHRNADAYCEFEENHHFFYLTGLRRENMILLMYKLAGRSKCVLYIEEADPKAERWTGKMVTADEAKAVSGIQDVRFVDRFAGEVHRLLNCAGISTCYFDCYRHSAADLPGLNLAKAREFSAAYPGVQVRNLWPLVSKMRMQKDAEEIRRIRGAVEITDRSLRHMLKGLKPGMKEYQAQASFEYMVHDLGAEGVSFPTIAGSGLNGCMLHYETNRDTCKDGSLLLLDLGVRSEGYCSDITRTYPVNGKFTQRQRAVYDIVLEANKTVAREAKPGMTTRDLNELCKKVLAKGCMELGLIRQEQAVSKYYMHGVSHHLGLDVHDVTVDGVKLAPGSVITDEPGLYIDEWEIGIRIEDDLLITENGCEVLSQAIMREPEEIEAFMANHTAL